MAPGVHDSGRWRSIEEIFQAACDLPAADRPAFLDRACAHDPALRGEVEGLLASSDQTWAFLRDPVRDAAQAIAVDSSSEGRRVGPYEICEHIGDGGMGRVYLAQRADQVYRQQVAIKFMRADFGDDPEMQLRFRMERQILANLSHPYVARLLDGGVTEDGLPWLALEYVQGLPIDDYCRRNRLSLQDRLQLFVRVCSALEYAHRNLVIHRDIKPANVLVTAEGDPKLLDFGIAKLLASDFSTAVHTRAGMRLITPEYASPEQVRGEPVTTATDIHAMGALLFELLTGNRPFQFQTDSPLEIARTICEKAPTAPSAAAARDPQHAAVEARRLKGDLDTIVLMAMRKEPERRYASVAQLAGDVQAYLNGYPLLASGDTWRYRTAVFARRHKAAVAGAVLAAVSFTAFGIGMGILARRADRARQTAEREAQFLVGMFQAATPEEARGQTITARDLLDRGVARVDRELAAEPQARASLLESIAEAYRSLGLFDPSLALARRSLDLARAAYGPGSVEAGQSMELLAELERDKGRYAEAEPLLRQLIAARRERAGAETPATARRMAELGECLYLEGKDDESIALLQHTLSIDRRNGPNEGADTRNYLALALERKGEFDRARQLLQEAVDINRRTLGPDSPTYAISLHNLGSSLIDRGDLYGAEAQLREGLAIRRRILAPGHPDLFYSLNNLGSVLLQRGEWQAAAPFLQEALDIQLKSLGPDNPRLAAPLHNLGRIQEERGDYPQARQYFDRALRVLEDAKVSSTWPYAQIISSLGWIDFDEGQFAASEERARAAMELRRKLGGEETPEFAVSLVQVAEDRLFRNDAAGAEALLRQSLEIRRKRLSAGHPEIASTQVRLGEVLLAEGQAASALPLLHDAYAAAVHPPFPLPAWQVADALSAYGACLLALGRQNEGEALLRESRAGLTSHPHPGFRTDAADRLRRLATPHEGSVRH